MYKRAGVTRAANAKCGWAQSFIGHWLWDTWSHRWRLLCAISFQLITVTPVTSPILPRFNIFIFIPNGSLYFRKSCIAAFPRIDSDANYNHGANLYRCVNLIVVGVADPPAPLEYILPRDHPGKYYPWINPLTSDDTQQRLYGSWCLGLTL